MGWCEIGCRERAQPSHSAVIARRDPDQAPARVITPPDGKLSLSMMERVLEVLRRDAQRTLIGDPGQLTSIEARIAPMARSESPSQVEHSPSPFTARILCPLWWSPERHPVCVSLGRSC
jgi:hypothetical protein